LDGALSRSKTFQASREELLSNHITFNIQPNGALECTSFATAITGTHDLLNRISAKAQQNLYHGHNCPSQPK